MASESPFLGLDQLDDLRRRLGAVELRKEVGVGQNLNKGLQRPQMAVVIGCREREEVAHRVVGAAKLNGLPQRDNAHRRLEGVVTVKDLLLSDDEDVIENIMDTNVIFVRTTDDRSEAAERISDYDLLAIPVVDKEDRLVGIVTVDDVIDVLEEEATEDFDLMAGISPSDKPYSRTGVVEMWKRRIPWLMFLMLSATFTSMIITHFEDALAKTAVLTGFIPMLMGTGGNSGSQSSTAVIRSLSIGDTEPSDILSVIWKEIRVAVMCGVCLACVNFVKMLVVDRMLLGNPDVTTLVAFTVSATIVFVVIFAKAVGCTLPMIAEKIGIDPAVMASPLISTITDAVSLLIYFALSTLILQI